MHRRTPSRQSLVLPGWYFVLSGVVCVAAAAVLLAVLLPGFGSDGDGAAAAPSTSSTPSATPSAEETTPEPSASTSPTPSPSPSARESTAPQVDRAATAVSVLNGTRTPGLARQSAARVQQRGWQLRTVGNWRGFVPQTTVFFPAGQEAQARLLAADLGIGSVAPAVAGMSTAGPTVVVLSNLS